MTFGGGVKAEAWTSKGMRACALCDLALEHQHITIEDRGPRFRVKRAIAKL